MSSGGPQMDSRGLMEYHKYYKDHKNSPEMNVSEGDLISVKILSKSVEKLKSYRFSLEGPFFP